MKLFLVLLWMVQFSCADEAAEDSPVGGMDGTGEDSTFEGVDGTNTHFPTYLDAHNLRFFARPGVSSDFLSAVSTAYGEMLKSSPSIDADVQQSYLSTTEAQHVFQLVGLVGPENYSSTMDERPQRPWEDHGTDYIWELSTGGPEQIGEVLEHLLHTVTAVGLKLAFPEAWDYMDESSALFVAMQEAIAKDVYRITDYEALKGDAEGYNKVLATEFIYWLILAEWDYFETAGKNEDGGTGNSEFTLASPAEIESNLPLGHQFYLDHVVKVLSVPDKAVITALFP